MVSGGSSETGKFFTADDIGKKSAISSQRLKMQEVESLVLKVERGESQNSHTASTESTKFYRGSRELCSDIGKKSAISSQRSVREVRRAASSYQRLKLSSLQLVVCLRFGAGHTSFTDGNRSLKSDGFLVINPPKREANAPMSRSATGRFLIL